MLLKSIVTTAVTLLAVAPEVQATFGLGRWGCDIDLLGYKSKKICTIKGAFGCNIPAFGGLCSSDRTRVPPPAHITCPSGWFKHYENDCCIPVHVDQECNCPPGSTWDNQKWQCSPQKRDQCQPGYFYHDKLGCCPQNSPPKGNCPDGHCPDGWYWNYRQNKCFPLIPDCPPPSCYGWNWDDCRCRPPPTPSGGYTKPVKPHRYWKKDQAAFPVTQEDVDNCPANLHSCPVTGLDGETSYECIDFATELESCGGCASVGEGLDCTAIPNVDSVGCEAGVCKVFSCNPGFSVVNGTSCL